MNFSIIKSFQHITSLIEQGIGKSRTQIKFTNKKKIKYFYPKLILGIFNCILIAERKRIENPTGTPLFQTEEGRYLAASK